MNFDREKIIHICFSQSAFGSLRHILNKNLIKGEKVIGLYDNLANGDISKIHSIKERLHWNEKFVEKEEWYDSEELKENYRDFYSEVSKIKDEKIYLWYGNNAREYCGMLFALSLLKEKSDKIHTINVSTVTYKMNNGNEFTPRTVGEAMPEKLVKFIDLEKKVSDYDYNHLINLWDSLIKENSILRIYQNNEVLSVDEGYFDKSILERSDKEFKKAARIVGFVLGYSEEAIGDEYIFWRMKELVKKGYLEYRGSMDSMRTMEAKRTNLCDSLKLEYTALIIIDVQRSLFSKGLYKEDILLKNISTLIKKAREENVPVIYIQHTEDDDKPMGKDKEGWQIHPHIAPGEKDLIVLKHKPDSFYKTNLEEVLIGKNIKKLVFAGLQTEYCVDTTCRQACSLGYDTVLVKDAHSTYDTEILKASQIIEHHNMILGNSFVKLKATDEVDFS